MSLSRNDVLYLKKGLTDEMTWDVDLNRKMALF